MRTVLAVLLLLGLALPAAPEGSDAADPDRELTAGLIQRELSEGLPAEEVALALGSPNIVTRDAEGVEAWIYDRISTRVSYRRRSAGLGGGGLGSGSVGGGGLAGLLGGHLEKEEGDTRTTQRSLTLIVKFDGDGRVASFRYRASRF